MDPTYNMRRMSLYLYPLPPQNPRALSSHKENITKPKLRDTHASPCHRKRGKSDTITGQRKVWRHVAAERDEALVRGGGVQDRKGALGKSDGA